MRCPFCGHLEDRVVDSRLSKDGEAIRRRRECLDCTRRFTTYERSDEMFPQIIKSDGRREDYDRLKIHRGIRLACSKRPIAITEIDAAVDSVEELMLELNQREVSSDWIGSAITERLRDLDPIAYIRFASVYRGFSDIAQFLQELRVLEEDSETGNSVSALDSPAQEDTGDGV